MSNTIRIALICIAACCSMACTGCFERFTQKKAADPHAGETAAEHAAHSEDAHAGETAEEHAAHSEDGTSGTEGGGE